MSKSILLIAALSALAACAAAANPSAAASGASYAQQNTPPHTEASRQRDAVRPDQGLSCEVLATSTRAGVRLEAVAHAHDGMSGEYELVITKDGAGGSSNITQGGPFDAAPGAVARLGSAEIGLERNARYRAVLTLRDVRGELCRHVRRG